MSQWLDRINTHAAFKSLNTLKAKLVAAEHRGGLDAEKSAAVERLRQVREHIEGVLSSVDPYLVPIGPLNGIEVQLSKVIAEVDQFNANHNAGHLVNANSTIDAALAELAKIPFFGDLSYLEGIREAATSYRRSVAQYRRYVLKERDGLKAPVEEVKKDLASVGQAVRSEKERLDSFASELQEQFSKSEDSRREQFAASQSEKYARFEKAQEARSEVFEGMVEHLDTITKNTIEEIESHRDKAQELVYVISNTGMVGGYQSLARTEKRTAIFWQVMAAVSMLGLVGFAILAFHETVSGEVSWGVFAGRAFVAFAFGILAAYAARQGDKHEGVERSSKRMELALASIDPYLVDLPEEQRHEIKKELALKYFSVSSAQETDLKLLGQRTVSGNVTDLAQLALETVLELLRKQGGPKT